MDMCHCPSLKSSPYGGMWWAKPTTGLLGAAWRTCSSRLPEEAGRLGLGGPTLLCSLPEG